MTHSCVDRRRTSEVRAVTMLMPVNFYGHYVIEIIVPMNSFYRIIFYLITYILSPFSTNHIYLCLGSLVDMVSNIDPVSMIFDLSLQ